jgi:hypothetical protein
MGVVYIFEGIYQVNKKEEKQLENLYNKPIFKISNKEFNNWYKQYKLK